MPTKAICCFTHLTRRNLNWRDADYSVKKFVDGIKGREINMHAYIPVGDGPRRYLAQSNAADAITWFGEMAAPLIRDESVVAPILVPFPNSKCILGEARSRTASLADAIASIAKKATVADILRFDEPMPSANEEDGPRHPREIYPHLRLTASIDKTRPYVLVDDVMTSGGHGAAGVAKLRSRGANVRLIVCGVSAHQEQVPDPFARVIREIPDFNRLTGEWYA